MYNHKRMKNLLLLLFFLSGCIAQQKNESGRPFVNYEPTEVPDRIMMTIPGNPATCRAVSWRTSYADSASIGEITELNPSPDLEKTVHSVKGAYAPWENGSVNAMGHKVLFDGLKPSTQYAYRVGDGENWSEWIQFSTSSDRAEPFSFLYFGDVQNDIKSYGSRVLRQAYSNFPGAGFMLFAGDLVSSSTEEYWREFFYAGGWIFGMVPSIPTPGNHEYSRPEDGRRVFSKQWNQIYAMPDNGPSEESQNRTYFLDYQGVRFISVDSPAMGYDEKDGKQILDWLDKTLEENPYRWSVVFTHYPVYSCSQGRSGDEYRKAIKPVLEKHGVDLVLQGHDHTYCRGQNLKEAGQNNQNSPVYVVSVAGPKMYGLNTSFWSDRMASNTQLYQQIAFNGDSLTFKSFSVDGKLYDEFQIIKDKKGKNHVLEADEVARIKERTEIPEGAVKKYSEEELRQYQQKFNK